MFTRNPEWHKLTGAIRFPHKMKDVQEIIDRQGVAIFKTHDSPEVLSQGDTTPVIYLVRDGREACVSYWHYYREILEDQSMTLERIIRGDCLFGSWSEHLRAWKVEARRNTLGMGYEQTLANTPRAVAQLQCFLGARHIRSRCQPWQDFHDSDPQFFRSGTNDTWKTEMTGDDLALFNELHGDTMREYGYYPAKEPIYA